MSHFLASTKKKNPLQICPIHDRQPAAGPAVRFPPHTSLRLSAPHSAAAPPAAASLRLSLSARKRPPF